jgi:HlyD family secretion protein
VKKSRIVIITAVVTLVVVFVIMGLIKSKSGAAEKGVEVRLEEVKRGELIEFVSAPGEIEPKTKVEISAKVSARIIELPYEEGEVVTCGDASSSVLVRLDAKDLESNLRSAQASRLAQAAQIEVERARVASQQASLDGLSESLKQAERDLERQKGLFESRDISESTFDKARCKVDEQKAGYAAAAHSLEAAKLNLVVLRHNLEVADARIEQAAEALSYTTILSPIDGIITRLNAEDNCGGGRFVSDAGSSTG